MKRIGIIAIKLSTLAFGGPAIYAMLAPITYWQRLVTMAVCIGLVVGAWLGIDELVKG